MKHTQNEILNALNVIKDTCRESKDCENCPFRKKENEKICNITSSVPVHWKTKKVDETWRAFK